MQQQTLVAGDSLSFLTAGGDYPASSGWSLTYLLVPRASGSPITITGSAEGDDHRVAVAAGSTVSWAAGLYTWFERVEKAGEKYTLRKGQLTIDPNPSALSGGHDSRSQAEIALDNVNALLMGRASDGVLRYKIAGRELERYTLVELMKLQRRLEIEVAGERRAAGLDDPRGSIKRIFVRMP